MNFHRQTFEVKIIGPDRHILVPLAPSGSRFFFRSPNNITIDTIVLDRTNIDGDCPTTRAILKIYGKYRKEVMSLVLTSSEPSLIYRSPHPIDMVITSLEIVV